MGKRPVRRAAKSRQKRTAIESGPEIEIDSRANLLRVCDPRLINANHRVFCERLLETVVLRDGVSKADVDLGSATCRVQFSERFFDDQAMAELFADCVRVATEGSRIVAAGGDVPRDKTAWTNMTAYPLSHDASLWETLEAKPGQIQVRHRFPSGAEPPPPEVAKALARLEEVAHCHASPRSDRLTVNFQSRTKELNGFMDRAEQSLEELLSAAPHDGGAAGHAASLAQDTGVAIASGLKRVVYLVLAGGSFVMTLVGLVVPGVPTVPFLLATSYFLARSSRRLHDWLARSAFFGPILTEWDARGGLSPQSKLKLIGLAGAIVVVTVVLAPLTPLALAAVLLVASLGSLGVLRLPDIPRGARVEDSAGQRPRLALPAF